ncbi:uncharacterized protein TRAVEDRAFT_130662 [Trametes versicolor FP-101664 SS1]|uniref:uncharacterized protein n=1 Tax=Trametes versicolor (strain FP-101664) TaxID=717944 RepID=UPI000462300C|nr:uncharacterized protein TRAVEDRAFT_130662 [Trametes versicolor FP-101664 SS1]EIW55005.1 hypothetical protein TRAVEDRAFT_130662 [Trametes versicolor FP-101664 SS1]
MSNTPNPLFKFSREGFSVRVNNIADAVSRREILDLFNNLIGDIVRCEEMYDRGRRYYLLTFSTQDSAKKALCMTGYNVDGVPLSVVGMPLSDVPRSGRGPKQPDTRRNLYVLGLPFDLTKTEFAEIFGRFGAVAHAVILATVDNASRRRGFIVMARHHDAKVAMEGLNRKDIKGHIIDVSWAVVQRSDGFLDGGDRATVLSTTSPSGSPTPFEMGPISPTLPEIQMPIVVTPPSEYPPTGNYAMTSSSLMIKNLPAVLFSQLSDLHPLLGPYGDIKKLEILPAAPGDRAHVSAIVEYATSTQATDAANGLNGQAYSVPPLSVEFVRTSSAQGDADGKPGLNPRAVPFAVRTGHAHLGLRNSVSPMYPGSGYSEAGLAALGKSGLLSSDPRSMSSSYGTPLLYVPYNNVRPSSAPTTSVHPQFLPMFMC